MVDPSFKMSDVQRLSARPYQPQDIAPLTIGDPPPVQEPSELVEEHILGLGEGEHVGGRSCSNFHHPSMGQFLF